MAEGGNVSHSVENQSLITYRFRFAEAHEDSVTVGRIDFGAQSKRQASERSWILFGLFA